MDLTQKTPVEIDTELYGLYGKLADLNTNLDRAHRLLKLIEETEPGSYEALLPQRSPQRRAELHSEMLRLRSEADALRSDEITPREVEWRRRGCWTRYYMVDNTNGHVHKDTHCTTCFFTTRYSWLVEQSGMSAEDLVKLAGEKACTVCFPWAPVDTLKQKTRLESVEKKAARLEREAKKAAREAKAAASAITNPDGTPLRENGGRGSIIKTIRSAWIEITNEAWYQKAWGDEDGRHQREMEHLAKAIAHKEGKTVEQVIEEAKKKAAKRK